MTVFEFSEGSVGGRIVPAKLCILKDSSLMWKLPLNTLAKAEKIYHVAGNKATDIKNRQSKLKTRYISDEDKVALMLAAVLL